nr:flagellar hook-basal body complex protein FliE [Marinifaba aquimaris]
MPTLELNQTVQPDQDFSLQGAMSNAITDLNAKLIESNQLLEKVAMGKEVSTHEVMLTMTEAKLSLQLAVEVRNKLLESYQEVMRMQL